MQEIMNKPRNQLRVVVGISGGVDSSVAALLLLTQGYEVHGVFMKNWEETFEAGYCSAEEDLADAKEVCATLEICLHTVNFSEEYRNRVFNHFLEEYRRGRTPNPDILCNKEIKFKAFLDYARRLGADFIATGHYARRLERNGLQHLQKGVDQNKDQSYFLYTLRQDQLIKTLFPLGDLCKSQVRELAAQADLVTYDKKDSTGICFIGERDFRDFLGRFLPAQPGAMHDPNGEWVGEHSGLMFYTRGQRQGLGIGGRRGAEDAPWYVVDKDLSNNVLIVAQGSDHPLLFKRRLSASGLHWIADTPRAPFRCKAKSRYRQYDQDCTIETLTENHCVVVFDTAQRAITPGQSVVFYRGDECLGGGIIDAAFE